MRFERSVGVSELLPFVGETGGRLAVGCGRFWSKGSIGGSDGASDAGGGGGAVAFVAGRSCFGRNCDAAEEMSRVT